MTFMVAAYIWHWWVGVVFTILGILTVVGVAAGYIKQVSASRFPGKRQRRGHDEG